ncbi:MAG: hypothetical protein J6I55_10500 [Ruminococcus sp.]|nr:hypothetical protein [Ruminococcus sp.]
MEDIRTVACDPKDEISTVQLWESFGYYLFSSNEVYNKDTSVTYEDWGDFVIGNSHVDITHYVKMVFRRDPKRLNYEKLVELENQFVNTPLPEKPSSGWSLLAIGIWLMLCFPVAIFMIIHNTKKVKPEMDEYKKKLAEYENARANIVQEARKLVV